MINCSRKQDFVKHCSDLERALHRRGFPRSLLQPLQYDIERRQDLLQKLHSRSATKTKNSGDTIVYKTEYSPQLRRFMIKAHIHRLFKKLGAELGDTSFLRDSRVIIAHPSRRSLFVDTYCWNYLKDDNCKQLGLRAW